MKKLLILIVAVVATATIYSQNMVHYTAEKVNFKFENKWLGWQDCGLPVIVITDLNQINIYSPEPNFINYGRLYKKEYKDYTLLYAQAVNTYYQDLKIEWYLYKSGITILKIIIPTFEIKYRLKQNYN